MTNRFITQTAAPGAIRQDTFNDRDFTVVPVVALREGVFQCSTCEGPELYLAKEFAGNVESWNGRPVTMGHPKRDGMLVSAGSKDIHEKVVIGVIFNAEIDNKKLKLEAWIDNEKVKELNGDAGTTLERINAGEQVEVSTGYFANVRPSSGKFNGESYIGVQTNVVPDHLAILEDGAVGACSWKDGCGAPRLNINEACCDPCADFRDTLHDSMMRMLAEHGELSDTDRRRALEAVLNLSDDLRFAWVVAVFSDTFIFEHNGALWRQGFVISDDGTISLGDDLVKVRPETQFVDVKTNQETAMDKEQKVNGLIANKATKFTDENKTWLMSLEEEQLDMLAPVEAAPAEKEEENTPASAPANKPEDDPDEDENSNSEEEEPVTLKSYIGDAPAEIQELLTQGVKLQVAQSAKLIKTITANKHCSFTEDELKDKTLDELTKLAALSGADSYEGAAPRGTLQDHEDPDAAPEAPLVFNLGKEADAA